MSCAVAIAGSPVFSPTREALFSKLSSSSSPSADPLARVRSPVSSPSPSPSPSSASSSALRLRLQRQAAGKADGGPAVEPSPAVLKRKRPARLDIPLFSTSFAEGAGKETVAAPAVVEVDTDRFSVVCKKGKRRVEMEDRYSAELDLTTSPKQAFYGIFDGHGGTRAAEFAAKNMARHVMEEVVKHGEEEVLEAIKIGYLTTDMEFEKEGVRGGACCVTALIRNGNLIVSNAGDCRAVLSRGGVAEALTVDHHPSRDDERDRLQKLGGYVDNCNGVWRLQGSLAVSRGIGDSNLKKWVTAEPDTRVLKLEPDCEFLILASDGLWDKVSNQEAVNVARSLCVDRTKLTILTACKRLVDLASTRGSVDDISVMIVKL